MQKWVSLFYRWVRFSAVGATGILVQSATLALLLHATGLHYLAATALADARTGDGDLRVVALAGLPDAVRTRVLHAWAVELGAPGGALSHRHVAALDALTVGWHGQGPTALPGGIVVARRAGDLVRVVPKV